MRETLLETILKLPDDELLRMLIMEIDSTLGG